MARDSTTPMEPECTSQDTKREASGVWIKDFECRSCGSTLGRWADNDARGGIDKMCFCCGAGDFELSDAELAGLDFEDAAKLAGREWGNAHDIYVRVNSPAEKWSTHITSPRARNALCGVYGKFADIIEERITLQDIKDVTRAMEELIKETEQCTTK